MVIVFISVAVVLAALDVFVFLMLKRLVTATGKNLRRGVVKQLGAYDSLFAAKSVELAQMQQQARTMRKNASIVTEEVRLGAGANTVLVPPARYRGEGFTTGYREIREGFRFDARAVFEGVKNTPSDEKDDEFVKNADKLLERLTFNALYGLSQLDEEEQLAVCLSACTEGEAELIREYLTLFPHFDAPEFACALRMERDNRDNTIYIRTARETAERFEGAHTAVDPSLCEGMTLRKHGILYDYSIAEREIG